MTDLPRPGVTARMRAEAAVALLMIRVGLRLAGFRRVQRAISGGRSTQPRGDLAQARRISQAVSSAAYRLRATCLERSMALWWLLHSRGIESSLCIGVRKENQMFQAHAWVEVDGLPLNERPEVAAGYTVLAENLIPAGISPQKFI